MKKQRQKNRVSKVMISRPAIADPASMLRAAEEAPTVFSMPAYFRPIYLMRKKGYSWRELAKWVRRFNVEISAVHLRRLYVQEDKRLTRLSEKELARIGMPREMIREMLEKDDPTGRLLSPDPKAAAVEARREGALLRAGISEEERERVDVNSPIKIGDVKI